MPQSVDGAQIKSSYIYIYEQFIINDLFGDGVGQESNIPLIFNP